ncbi:hypothetical protein NFC81_10785 [Salinispirillum sp. LH 10-3-1]|uniref:Uncharacterized protein n=1 Tax=Salinispirillum sp. LH 10-3-1 TaxID=2952525 RepID=A0AB38YCW2_9GAMM
MTIAVDWRLELDQLLTATQTGSGELPLGARDDVTANSVLKGQISHSGALVRLRLQNTDTKNDDEDWALTVPEAFYDASAGPLELTVGRKALQWDYGFFAAPLNWLGPDAQEQHYEARPLVSVEMYAGLQVWQAACAPEHEAEDALCVLRTEGFSRLFDWQLLAGYDGAPRVGAGLYWLAHDALALRFSGAWTADAPATEWQPGTPVNGHLTSDPLSQTQRDRTDMLFGLTWTHAQGTEALLEHHWDNSALSRRDWQALQAQRKRLEDQPEPAAGLRAANLGWMAQAVGLDPMVEHRTLIRLSQTWSDWTWRATGLSFWTDDTPTWLTELSANYQWNSVATVSADWRYHDNNGVLADLGHVFKLTLNVQTGG